MLAKMPSSSKLAPAPSRGSAPFRDQMEAVKGAISIERVAGVYGVSRRHGNGRMRGRCLSPEHEDGTPSMDLDPDTQSFTCYGCGTYGYVIDLVMLAERPATWLRGS
jgi:DNA primase